MGWSWANGSFSRKKSDKDESEKQEGTMYFILVLNILPKSIHFNVGNRKSMTDINRRCLTLFPFQNNHSGNIVEYGHKGDWNLNTQGFSILYSNISPMLA